MTRTPKPKRKTARIRFSAKRYLAINRLESRLCLSTDLFQYSSLAASDADGPTAIVVADFDNDGDQDVVTSSERDHRIGFYRFDPDSVEFAPQSIIGNSLLRPQHLTAADINDDGKVDVIAASDSTIIWYPNQGDGQFPQAHVVESGLSGISEVFIHDIDKDGDTDIVSTSIESGTLTWYENIEASFLSHEVATQFLGIKAAAAADMDSDRDEDLILVSTTGATISWLFNDGSNSFTESSIIDVATPRLNNLEDNIELRTEDLNEDGFMDIVASIGGEISWYQQDPLSEKFDRTELIDLSNSNILSIDIADLDNDGDMDVVYGSERLRSQLGWIELNLGVPERKHSGHHRSNPIDQVVAADFDLDGMVDVASISTEIDQVGWHRNLVNEVQTNVDLGKVNVITNGAVESVSVIRTGDIDGDDDLDLVAIVPEDGSLQWIQNIGHNEFASPTIIATARATGAREVWDIQLVDLDGNDALDILWAQGSSLAWYRNGGSGQFESRIEIAKTDFLFKEVTTGDLNDDGDSDILVTYINDRAQIFENVDGNASFQPTFKFPRSNETLLGDVDGDGDLDVISAHTTIQWYENVNEGFLGPHPTSGTATFPNAIFPVDMDLDGDLDIFSGVGTRSVFQENVGGSYVSHPLNVRLEDSRHMEAFDVNSDGILDLIIGGSNGIKWYAGLPDRGQFDAGNLIDSDAISLGMLLATDVDNDGDTDLLSSTSDDGTIAIYRNLENNPAGDFTNDTRVSSEDVDALYGAIRSNRTNQLHDLNADDSVNQLDVDFLVKNTLRTTFGDVDFDGVFGSHDLVLIFQAGTYETGLESVWLTGDWNGDQVFDSSDLVFAFQRGRFSPRG